MSEGAARNRPRHERLPAEYYKKDFWSTENLKYSAPHFRMRKIAKLVRQLARGRQLDLLDVGCGPGALADLMPSNIRYYGIDISIPRSAGNFLEFDILQEPIGFNGMKFDLVVAQGLFEYMGEYQAEKFAEIAALLKENGKFILTYQNFDHRNRSIYWPYSNVQRPAEFRRDLARFFRVERCFAGAHNWNHNHPGRAPIRVPQEHLNIRLPVISAKLATDYFYICAPLG